MGGCFPCFGSSDRNGAKEATKKDSAKDGATALSHRVSRVSSGDKSMAFLSFSRVNSLGFCLFSSLWLP